MTDPESSWASLATTDINTLEYEHTGLTGTDDVQYKVRALSTLRGNGNFSARSTFILASVPTVSNAPTIEATTKNSITVSWDHDSGASVVLGYKLYRYNKALGGSVLAYDGSKNAVVTSYKDTGLASGISYGYRVVAINRVGTSALSPEKVAETGEAPGKPPAPTYVSSTSTSITLSFEPVVENGGLPITRYHLYRDQGSLTSSFTEIASYLGTDMQFEVTQANESGMVSGETYRFYFTAENAVGEGPASDIVSFALGPLPSTPAAPTLNRDYSTQTSLYVTWSALTGEVLDVEGYGLYMSGADESGGFELIYDGFSQPENYAVNVTGLTPGNYYSFYLVAKNYNGYSEAGAEDRWLVCTLSGLDPPVFVSATRTSISLKWSAPINDGGCPITTYGLFMYNSVTTTFDEVDQASIQNKPYITSWTVTGLTDEGTAHIFKLTVSNEIETIESDTISVILAAVPDKPSAAPTQDYTAAGSTRIGVKITALSTSENGGSAILGYQIWRDNGQGGDFVSLYENDSVMATSYLDTGLVNGRTYRYKYRVRNINGWSAFSDVGYLVAASVPGTPPIPSLASVDDTQFTITLNPPSNSGGSRITQYELFIDGGSLNTAFTSYGTFTGSSGTHSLTVSGDGLTAGKIYRVRWLVRSVIGDSQVSEAIRVGLGAQAETPANLALNLAESGPGSIAVTWDAANDGNLPILGYTLQIKDSSFITVYNGKSDPDTTSFKVDGLVPGKYYEFRVYSHNFNGASLSSTVLGAYACGNPSGFSSPRLVSTTSSSITIEWDAPLSNGGCVIKDYAIYRDEDGSGSAPWTEVNPSATYTRNDPFNREFECTTFPTGAAVGDTFSFYVKAITVQASADSDVSSPFLLGTVPVTPTSAPTVVTALTDGTQVSVAFEAVTDNGGSSITSYELQKGSLSLSDFVTVSGAEPKSLALSFTVTKDIQEGAYYAFRYRAVNAVGASGWSPIGRIQAGTKPDAPPTPIYVSATNETVTLTLTNTLDNGGSKIIETKLFRDSGNRTSTISVEVTAYAGESQYTVTGLTPMTTYRFAYVATNQFGDSDQSNPITVETSTTPLQLNAPSVDWTKSSKTSLYITWDAVPDPDATIRGYILSMDDGSSGTFTDVFEGVFEPSTLSFLKTGLTTGKQYRFKVRAAGYNEEGPESAIASFYACTSPSSFESPTAVQKTKTSITIQWKAPADDGGCTLSGYAVFRDDGSNGDITTEVNSANDAAVRGNPSLDNVVITNFDAGGADLGKTFRIKVTAFNIGGREADSGAVALVLASIPDTPSVGPVNDNTVTSSSKIRVTYGITSPPDNGGSPILSYALEIDNGKGGTFKKVVGFASNSLLTAYTITSNIQKGLEYRLRYRVKNAIGWSDYSDSSFILAANVPDAPPKPTFSSFDTLTLKLEIQPSKDNGGSPIKEYVLYRYSDTLNDFESISTHTPNSLIYSATAGSDGYAIGSTYRFRVVVTNAVGTSEPSDEAYIALGDVPAAPSAIVATE